jgi:hypothetical protein
MAYKPTILNGDPVEVDTTITIAFGAVGRRCGRAPWKTNLADGRLALWN